MHRPLIHAVLIIAVLAACRTNSFAVASDADAKALIRRSCTAWSEYQGMRVTGTTKRFVDGELEFSHDFIASIGYSDSGKCPPIEIGFLVPNPGEPHLDAKEIFGAAAIFNKGIDSFFERRYVSEPPCHARMSILMIGSSGGNEYWAPFVFNSIVTGMDGGDPRFSHDTANLAARRCQLEIMGKEGHFGQECLRARFTMPSDIHSQEQQYPPIQFEYLFATEPTLQGVKVLSVSGGKEGWADTALASYQRRTVQSMKIMGKWLLCNEIRFAGDDSYIHISLHTAEELPRDYVGMWDLDSITGVDFSGPLEKATRRGSIRQKYSHTPHVTYIPYTSEEQSKIRKFMLAQGTPVVPQTNWTKVALWLANGLAVCVLAWWGYRRFYAARMAAWLMLVLCGSGLAQASNQPIQAEETATVALPNVPISVGGGDGFCGIAAAEYVAKRLDGQLIDGPQFQHLRQQELASLSDLRLCFSESGLVAKSYELGLHDQAAWTHLAAVLRQGSGQLILLVPTADPASQERSGHYLVVERMEDNKLVMMDPLAAVLYEIGLDELYANEQKIAVQLVEHPSSSAIHRPLASAQIIGLLLVPLAVLGVVLAKPVANAMRLIGAGGGGGSRRMHRQSGVELARAVQGPPADRTTQCATGAVQVDR